MAGAGRPTPRGEVRCGRGRRDGRARRLRARAPGGVSPASAWTSELPHLPCGRLGRAGRGQCQFTASGTQWQVFCSARIAAHVVKASQARMRQVVQYHPTLIILCYPQPQQSVAISAVRHELSIHVGTDLQCRRVGPLRSGVYQSSDLLGFSALALATGRLTHRTGEGSRRSDREDRAPGGAAVASPGVGFIVRACPSRSRGSGAPRRPAAVQTLPARMRLLKAS